MSCSFPSPLSEKEEQYYVKLLEKNDPDARNILIERNLRLVAHIAKKYSNSDFMQDDLISIGSIGLIKAINTYTSKKSTRLATYASRCIENEILMSIRSSKKNKHEVSLSLPIGTDKDGNEINLNDILGTDPEEISNTLHMKLQILKLYEIIDKELSPREKYIIIHRYGLKGYEPLPQRKLASHLGISRSYVSRLEKKALEKITLAFKTP